MKCTQCGYDDHGTGDSAHVCAMALPLPDYRQPDVTEVMKAEGCYCASCDLLGKDLAHWKNNHATEVRRARILKERPDMPIERVQAYDKWGEDQREVARLRAELAMLRTGDTCARQCEGTAYRIEARRLGAELASSLAKNTEIAAELAALKAHEVADAARVIAWARDPSRKSANLEFTAGAERQAAYWIEWAQQASAEPVGEVRAKRDNYGGCFVLWKQQPVPGMKLYAALPAPAAPDVRVSTIEKLRTLMTRLGLSTEESVESFGFHLEDNLLRAIRAAHGVLDKVGQMSAEPVAGSLLPCPFCAAKPTEEDVSEYFVECPSCGIEGPAGPVDSTGSAIEAWNRRATPPVSAVPAGWRAAIDELIAANCQYAIDFPERRVENMERINKARAMLAAAPSAPQPACSDCGAKQAKIDALMLEYCPDEMTPEQVVEWGQNQKPDLSLNENEVTASALGYKFAACLCCGNHDTPRCVTCEVEIDEPAEQPDDAMAEQKGGAA